MTRTWKVLLAVLIVVGLLVAALIATTPEGSEFRWSGNKVVEEDRRPRYKTYPKRYRAKVTRRAQQLRSTARCRHRFVATAHTWGGSQWFHEIISFDSRIEWCGNVGGRMHLVSVSVTPDNARFLWGYNGVVGSSQGRTSGAHCGQYPQPVCMFVEKHVQYSRAFEGIGQFTTPQIRWVVTASGGCQIRKPSGDWEGCNR